MKERMTSRERILAAVKRQAVDRPPVSPWGMGKVDPQGAVARELIARTDMLLGAGGVNAFLGKRAEVTTERRDDVTTEIIRTPKGDLVRKRRRTAVASAQVEFPLKGPEDVDKLLSIPYEPPDINAEAFRQKRRELGEDGLVFSSFGGNPVCVAASWFSPEDFCMQWLENREMIERLTAVAAERMLRTVERMCEAGIDAFRMVGGEYVTVQLGPSAVAPLLRQHDREIIKVVHDHGGVVFYHVHGPMMRYLKDFLDFGFDVLDPMEAPPWGDADLKSARKIINGKFTILGNLDDMEVLGKYPAERVKEMARANLEAYGTQGHMLGGTTSGTYDEHAARNFMAMVEVAEEYS